jgi:ribonucleoside-diphosphate reductase alpha chain
MYRIFTSKRADTEYEWTDIVLKDKDGSIKFQRNCEFPINWSYNAKLITASKYFTNDESSLKKLLERVVYTITEEGIEQNSIDEKEADIFYEELHYILENQYASFNSPVWFNIGAKGRPQQASACFLLDVQDNMESILDWIKTEAIIFKGGSGSGVNISKLRADGEPIYPRGTSGGPLSFMAGADCMAGVIKSGSVARRAAKMVIMDSDHPDIFKFINCKKTAEDILRKFKEVLGENIDVNSELLSFIPYQNANNSVSVTDEFMNAVKNDLTWELKNRGPHSERSHSFPAAKHLFREIAQVAWECGDPGLFYYDNSNKWHTCKDVGPIITTNPCGEWQFLTWTPCNLASINLLKFLDGDFFDVNKFIHTVEVMIQAMDILCEYSDYPINRIKIEANKYRTLGLGYANLGALLMALGLPYDSEEARFVAASITSLMTAAAYNKSSELATKVAPFPEFPINAQSMRQVMKMHLEEHKVLENKVHDYIPLNVGTILGNAGHLWNVVNHSAAFRNAQVTLLAPTGTISFMMDCDTTGIEPELSLIKYKTLVGGGHLKIVNQNIERALKTLGYENPEFALNYIIEHNTVENGPIDEKDYPVFDCAFKGGGTRSISPLGHVKMVAAVQPFLSSGISKTINMPNDCTVEDVEKVYMEAWELGLKAISIYRDGSKVAQPVKSSEKETKIATQTNIKDIYSEGIKVGMELNLSKEPVRKRLPDTRVSKTHKFAIAGHEGYVTVGLYPDGKPGEIFITMSKEGSTISGLMDAFATSISIGLQYGVPLQALVDKFKHTRFEPMGFTHNDEIKQSSSIIDYIFRWLDLQFQTVQQPVTITETFLTTGLALVESQQLIGDICMNCGSIMIQSGTCKTCPNCGENTGCS